MASTRRGHAQHARQDRAARLRLPVPVFLADRGEELLHRPGVASSSLRSPSRGMMIDAEHLLVGRNEPAARPESRFSARKRSAPPTSALEAVRSPTVGVASSTSASRSAVDAFGPGTVRGRIALDLPSLAVRKSVERPCSPHARRQLANVDRAVGADRQPGPCHRDLPRPAAEWSPAGPTGLPAARSSEINVRFARSRAKAATSGLK